MTQTIFQRIAEMNEAFGNPKGDSQEIHVERIRKQCLNIPDEVCELMIALGADPAIMKELTGTLKKAASVSFSNARFDLEDVRDSLCDIKVFADGAYHLMGINADRDMNAVIDGVMTRFIKDEADLKATIDMHAAKGVTDVYFEGSYPKMVMKSASDQPDAPKGKFLKSASYQEPIFF